MIVRDSKIQRYVIALSPTAFLGYGDGAFYDTDFDRAYKYWTKKDCEIIQKRWYPNSILYKIIEIKLEIQS